VVVGVGERHHRRQGCSGGWGDWVAVVIALAIVLYLYEPATGDYIAHGVVYAGMWLIMRDWVRG
jgi:hypothetical protein